MDTLVSQVQDLLKLTAHAPSVQMCDTSEKPEVLEKPSTYSEMEVAS